MQDTVANLTPVKVKFTDRTAWKRQVVGVIRSIKPGTRFTSDEVRGLATRQGVAEPPEPNYWGQAVQATKRLCLARKTGDYQPTARKDGHRRVIAVWIRL